MITGPQIRAARAAVKWTTERLSLESGITSRTIKKLEQSEGIPPCRSSTLVDIQKALEAAGIEFIGTPEDAPGIRLRNNSR